MNRRHHLYSLSVGLVVAALMISTVIASAQQRTPIQFWFHQQEAEAVETMDALVERFHQQYPQYRVEVIQTGGMTKRDMWDRLLAAMAAGISPDLVYTDPQLISEWGITIDGFIPINSLVSTDLIEEQDIIPSAKDVLFVRGNWWGLPFRTDSRGLFYNIDHFNEAGLDPSRGPQTIAELDEYSQRLTRLDSSSNEISQLGFFPYRGNDATGLMYFWVFGGDFFDWETLRPTVTSYSENLEAMQWIHSYGERYGYHRPSSSDFTNGTNQSMLVQSTTALANYPRQNPDLNFGVDRIPGPEGLPPATLAAGVSLGVPQGAQNPEAAAQFALFLLSTESQVAWYEGAQSLPVRISALRELNNLVSDPREQALIDILPFGKTTPPIVERMREAMEQVQERMFRMEMTPQAALEEVQRISERFYIEAFPN